jgi:glutamine synthetase
MSNRPGRDEVLNNILEAGDQNVKLAIVDIDGVLRGKYIHIDKFKSVVEGGFGFCDVVFGWDCADECYDNVTYTGWHSGYPDAHAQIDVSTFRRVPWDDNTPFFLADFVDSEGNPSPVCPRQTLKKVIAKADSLGFKASFGQEFEWFNFSETPKSLYEKHFVKEELEPLTPGMFGYSVLRSGQNSAFFKAILNDLRAFDVPVEGLHTETGPGVYEAAVLYGDALIAADRAVLFKAGLKEIGHRFGIVPTFMAKWNEALPGSSGHLHQSLWKDGTNLFFDANDPQKLSKIFRHYVAGQMKLLPEILPLYAPTINSYKRLVEGMWAPTKVTWGIDNRTVALRAIPGSAKSTRLETRVPGADVNPYLAVAAALASGLYGVENELELTDEPIQGNGYKAEGVEILPADLEKAALRMRDSKLVNELLGEEFVQHFANSRLWEWRQFQQSVTNWELRRYFEII